MKMTRFPKTRTRTTRARPYLNKSRKTLKIHKTFKSRKTLIQKQFENGSTRTDVSGVIKLKLVGTPHEIGYAHGHLLKKEIAEMLAMYQFYIPYKYGHPVTFFIKLACDFFLPVIQQRYPEIYTEMKGIAQGSGVPVHHIVFLNSTLSLDYLYKNLPAVLKKSTRTIQKKYHNFMRATTGSSRSINTNTNNSTSERCTAFIATGSYTTDGNIVCAHNTNGDYIETQYYNVIAEVQPKTGYAFTMQMAPGYIFSGSDFFVTGAGIVGTETTINGFNAYEHRDPIYCRIRRCMQYGDTLDDYINILVANNSGDYACAWLFGSIKTKEIVALELGLKYHNIRRTKDGVYIGVNAAYDPRIRNLECSPESANEHGDIRTSNWGRHARLTEVLQSQRGKLNMVTSSKILSDHYDAYLKKVRPSARSICKHCELDDAKESPESNMKPFMPNGSVDAAVVDATTASKLSMLFRFGTSCGKAFHKNEFFMNHPQWSELFSYVKDRPSQPWIKI
jgi:hypothetical protein